MAFRSRQKGASALEYIVLVGAIAVVLAGAVAIFGGEIEGFFDGLMTDIFGESA
ncbi:Flp family type IVb pilin [Marinobacter lipolyticus]|uniref:Flp family type IVb pilin n=1 Tax=Marinobacter lipolyticus TaxID=209639 RepID=UPI001BCF248E|nr:Flp family type IVb pilin [Marinobacter lipolyticus]MBS8242174.1 Flp family type IVb pilin [Marinobacter lipolyticus]